jgi:hypothetical protein
LKPVDFVTALGQLLSNPALQTSFAENPHAVAELLNVENKDRALFTSLSPQQIHTQAKLLVTKRMREVYKFLPVTFKILGNDVTELFSQYAITYWPNTYRRHQDDAYQFCRYLKQHRIEYNHSEFNRIQFIHSQHFLGLSIARDAFVKGGKVRALQLFYKRKETPGEWRLFLKA